MRMSLLTAYRHFGLGLPLCVAGDFPKEAPPPPAPQPVPGSQDGCAE